MTSPRSVMVVEPPPSRLIASTRPRERATCGLEDTEAEVVRAATVDGAQDRASRGVESSDGARVRLRTNP